MTLGVEGRATEYTVVDTRMRTIFPMCVLLTLATEQAIVEAAKHTHTCMSVPKSQTTENGANEFVVVIAETNHHRVEGVVTNYDNAFDAGALVELFDHPEYLLEVSKPGKAKSDRVVYTGENPEGEATDDRGSGESIHLLVSSYHQVALGRNGSWAAVAAFVAHCIIIDGKVVSDWWDEARLQVPPSR